jgi:hypothetical protein
MDNTYYVCAHTHVHLPLFKLLLICIVLLAIYFVTITIQATVKEMINACELGDAAYVIRCLEDDGLDANVVSEVGTI